MTPRISHHRAPAEPGRKEGGYTMAMTAILLVPLMLMAALAVDVGSWYVKAQEVQRAADAAALAGVPFMPDFYNDAKAKALETAAKNGYTDGVNGVTIDVSPVPGNRRRLKVTITDPRVRTYFGVIVRNSITVTRSATAEYVLPVPLGSPRNYLGTGTLGKTTGVFTPEYLWASINGYCTAKEQGDQRASFYATGTSCTGTANDEYTETNYQYSIELPNVRTSNVDIIVYDGTYNEANSPADDFNPGGNSQSDMKTTYTLYQPDPTPLDDFDNPEMTTVTDGACTSTGAGQKGEKTFSPSSSTEGGYTFNPGSTFMTSSSSWWLLCRIPTSAPGGRYILRVTNQGTGTTLEKTAGSNNFAIAATPTPQRICDARTDATCPKVFANEYLSVRAAATSSTANFFLSEIGKEHAGKKVVVTLWDPAEGGQTLKIRRPTASNTWTDQTFNWSSTGGESGSNVSSIPVSSYNFNNELLTISFTLPTNYNPPTDNEWWQIAYTFASSSVTDRTTWSVNIVGDPVHLVG